MEQTEQSVMADVVELLFFDTFSHESSEELNLDLVQFPKPVFISEVRIIPLGARVQADLPGGVRLGATNPSQFEIEFFVNDLSKPGASTFESLGGLDYKQNGNIHLETERRVPTDGLVLRGWYTTITLAVYGALSRAPEPTIHDATADWVHQLPQPLEASAGERGGYVVEPPSDYGPPLPPACSAVGSEPPHHRPRTPPEQPTSAAAPLVKPDGLDALMSPGDVESISDTELERMGQEAAMHESETPPPGTPPPPLPAVVVVPVHAPVVVVEQAEAEQFEPILSDEEIVDDPDQFQDMDYDLAADEEELTKTFNPFAFELQPFVVLGGPWETRCRWSPCTDAARLEQLVSGDREPGPDGLEEWLLLAEQAPALLPHGLPCLQHKPEVMSRLADWVTLGLDLASAKEQPRPNLKVRHLKAGARLAETICACGPRHSAALLAAAPLHERLLELLEAEMMALSVRLMFLRALDASLNCPQGIQSLVAETRGGSGYQRLLQMALAPQLARVEFALASVLRKLHLHEALADLRHCAASISQQTHDQVSEDDARLSVCTLTEAAAILSQAHVLIGQPRRLLPATAQFELTTDTHDPYPGLYAMFRDQRLLQVLLLLLTHPGAGQRSEVVCAVAEVLEALSERRRGLHFLAAHPETAVALSRALLLGAEEVETPTALQSLGLRIAYRLHAMQLTDRLLNALADPTQPCADESELPPTAQLQSDETLDALHSLFLAALTAPGRSALAHVLCRGDVPAALLSFFADSADKNPAKGYAADLLMLTLRHSEHAPWLLRHGRDLMAAARREEKTQSSRLGDAVPWLRPLEKQHTHHDLAPLCETLSRCARSAGGAPGELVTCVRLLRHLAAPPRHAMRQLKHRHALLQLNSLGGTASLVETLAALGAGLEQPALHATTLIGAQGVALAGLALPTLQLLRRVLTALIRCRAAHADLSPVPALLSVHDLLYAFPPSAAGHAMAQAGCREVVDTLLAFTQPAATEADPVSKSLWTLTMAEVAKHAGSSPHCFLPGLLVLSEMLPLPLPVHARKPLTADQQLRAVNARTLWSAHLLPLNGALQDLVALASASSCAPLLQLARRVCVQLADLAAPSALAVARGLIDPALAALGTEPVPPAGATAGTPVVPEGAKETEEPLCSAHAARQLGFLAGLLAHAPVKAATLHLLASDAKCDLRYSSLIPRLCAILRRAAPEAAAHVLAQEAVISITQALCDADVSLAPGGTLPPRAILAALGSALLDHASGPHSASTLLPAVRALALLAETDAGFAQLKASLDRSPAALKSLFARLSGGFSASNTAVLCAVATSLEMLRLCLPGEEGRSLHLTVSELSAGLCWGEEHPIRTLETQLRESAAAEEDVLSLTESLAGLVRLLDEEDGKPPPPREWTEPACVAPEPLLSQFAARHVFVLGEVEEERLSSSYWLAPPPVDDLDQEVDQVPCDLVALARELLPDFALAAETERLCRVPAQAQDAGDKRREAALAAASRNKRPFVAPMRGRGAGRAANQRGDVFRSRPPNTSRPPSLHVDDFVALESSGQQPTGPTGYNKLAMRAAKDMMVVRGRARGRAFSQDRGGRFFPTAPYRRENGAARPVGPWDAPDKFPRFGRGAWPLKDHRERFGARGARREPARHPRTFSR